LILTAGPHNGAVALFHQRHVVQIPELR
jgi:hypothetical protein